jgi:hypothetical protein
MKITAEFKKSLMINSRDEKFEERSEKWRDSEKGDEWQDSTDSLNDALSNMDSSFTEIFDEIDTIKEN